MSCITKVPIRPWARPPRCHGSGCQEPGARHGPVTVTSEWPSERKGLRNAFFTPFSQEFRGLPRGLIPSIYTHTSSGQSCPGLSMEIPRPSLLLLIEDNSHWFDRWADSGGIVWEFSRAWFNFRKYRDLIASTFCV